MARTRPTRSRVLGADDQRGAARACRAAPLLAGCTLLAVAGCGGEPQRAATASSRQPAAAGPSLSAGALARQLGSGFRDALYRRAVMDQRGDETADLGQPLPTGLVERVVCAGGDAAPAQLRCTVRWQTAGGAVRWTTYAARVRAGCFSAGAVPRLPERYDGTTHAYGEDPANAIVSARKGC